jgi:hypothetical protein
VILFSLLIAALAAAGAVPSADVEIRSARLDYARPANTFGYSAIVTNKGPETARAVEMLVLLPPGAAARNIERCTGTDAPEPQGLVRCRLGTLRPGEERRVFMLVRSAERRPRVTAFAVGDTPDPDASNNIKRAATP